MPSRKTHYDFANFKQSFLTFFFFFIPYNIKTFEKQSVLVITLGCFSNLIRKIRDGRSIMTCGDCSFLCVLLIHFLCWGAKAYEIMYKIFYELTTQLHKKGPFLSGNSF